MAPPATLMIYLSCDSESSAIEEVMGGATERWCSEIREVLEYERIFIFLKF